MILIQVEVLKYVNDNISINQIRCYFISKYRNNENIHENMNGMVLHRIKALRLSITEMWLLCDLKNSNCFTYYYIYTYLNSKTKYTPWSPIINKTQNLAPNLYVGCYSYWYSASMWYASNDRSWKDLRFSQPLWTVSGHFCCQTINWKGAWHVIYAWKDLPVWNNF